MGKLCRAVVALTLVVSLAGCKFFGKQEDPPSPPPGQLADGSFFVGTWARSALRVNGTGELDSATTTTFSFDIGGSMRIVVRNQREGGTNCSASGQYRLAGANTIVIYIQLVSSADCGFPSQIQLTNVRTGSGYLEYTDSADGGTYRMFGDNQQKAAPTGVWNFNGSCGIQYLFLDQHGYFILVSNETLRGFYATKSGSLVLYYFTDDPSQVAEYTPFDSYVTNGQLLELLQTTSQGDLICDGTLM